MQQITWWCPTSAVKHLNLSDVLGAMIHPTKGGKMRFVEMWQRGKHKCRPRHSSESRCWVAAFVAASQATELWASKLWAWREGGGFWPKASIVGRFSRPPSRWFTCQILSSLDPPRLSSSCHKWQVQQISPNSAHPPAEISKTLPVGHWACAPGQWSSHGAASLGAPAGGERGPVLR